MQFDTHFFSLVFRVESLVTVFKFSAGNSDGFKKRKSPTGGISGSNIATYNENTLLCNNILLEQQIQVHGKEVSDIQSAGADYKGTVGL